VLRVGVVPLLLLEPGLVGRWNCAGNAMAVVVDLVSDERRGVVRCVELL
jgi:hypothetical protein